MAHRRGFTIVEVLVAVVLLTVGVLGLLTTAALVTRMTARGGLAAAAATSAARRLEWLRATGCSGQARGADTLYRGGTVAAVHRWEFTAAGSDAWLVRVWTEHRATAGRTRTDLIATALWCAP